MKTLCIGLSVASPLVAVLVIGGAGVASADIIPVSRSSHVFSHYSNNVPQSIETNTFDPFVANLPGANQNTTVSSTSFGGTVRNNPFAISTPHNPLFVTAYSDYTLNFHVAHATTFIITGDIILQQMTVIFRLTGPGGVLYTPTYTPNGPFGGQVATLNFNGLLAPGDYTLLASTSGQSDPSGFGTYGTINFQVNAAPTPGALGVLALGGLAVTRRRR